MDLIRHTAHLQIVTLWNSIELWCDWQIWANSPQTYFTSIYIVASAVDRRLTWDGQPPGATLILRRHNDTEHHRLTTHSKHLVNDSSFFSVFCFSLSNLIIRASFFLIQNIINKDGSGMFFSPMPTSLSRSLNLLLQNQRGFTNPAPKV